MVYKGIKKIRGYYGFVFKEVESKRKQYFKLDWNLEVYKDGFRIVIE